MLTFWILIYVKYCQSYLTQVCWGNFLCFGLPNLFPTLPTHSPYLYMQSGLLAMLPYECWSNSNCYHCEQSLMDRHMSFSCLLHWHLLITKQKLNFCVHKLLLYIISVICDCRNMWYVVWLPKNVDMFNVRFH